MLVILFIFILVVLWGSGLLVVSGWALFWGIVLSIVAAWVLVFIFYAWIVFLAHCPWGLDKKDK